MRIARVGIFDRLSEEEGARVHTSIAVFGRRMGSVYRRIHDSFSVLLPKLDPNVDIGISMSRA